MIRVALVDSSLERRLSVQKILSVDPEISVVGAAADGRAALEMVFRTSPKVIAIGMGEEGSECHYTVSQIMAHRPTAILLLASPGRSQGEMVAYMLAAGALDAMEWPQIENGCVESASASLLIDRIKLLTRVPVITHIAGKARPTQTAAVSFEKRKRERAAVAIVSSTGGPMALTQLLSALPSDLPTPLFIAQHIAKGFVEGMVDWFQQHSSLEIKVAENGDKAKPGLVLVAPGDRDIRIAEGGVVQLDDARVENGSKPAGDRLFQSIADIYGAGAIGIILTGMGDDGTQGAASIKAAGGRVIAQDQSTSAIFGMPAAAIKAGVVDEVLPLEAISRKLVEWIGR